MAHGSALRVAVAIVMLVVLLMALAGPKPVETVLSEEA